MNFSSVLFDQELGCTAFTVERITWTRSRTGTTSSSMTSQAMLYLDGSGFPRRILRDAGIYPVPNPPQPSLLHEEEGSLWRKRADLTVSLRVRYEQTARTRGSIQSAPAVIIH